MAKTKKDKITKAKNKISSTYAKTDDGTIQITFQIPYKIISEGKKKVLTDLAKDIEIPGFRKGKAPLDKVKENISKNSVIERVLNNILPKELAKVIDQHQLKLAVYPRLELISGKENETWQIRATSCEIPDIDLGDYKKLVQAEGKAEKIWTPGDAKSQDEKLTSQQKEQKVIQTLINSAKIKIPKILIDEEVNSRLSQLLASLDKLGLTLDGYLASINKNAQALREEYEKQAKNSITLELALNKVVSLENIKIDDKEIDEAMKVSSIDQTSLGPKKVVEHRRIVEATLKRREALKVLTSLL